MWSHPGHRYSLSPATSRTSKPSTIAHAGAAGPPTGAGTAGTRSARAGSSGASAVLLARSRPRWHQRRRVVARVVLARSLERMPGRPRTVRTSHASRACVSTRASTSGSANGSFVPWRNSIGICRPYRCSSRTLIGPAGRVQRVAEEHEAGGRHALGGGHRGHPPAVALAAGRTPAGRRRGRWPHRPRRRTAAIASFGEPGLFRPASRYGKLNRSAETPAAASASANPTMNGWSMPAPAPCATTSAERASAPACHAAATSPWGSETEPFVHRMP